MCLGCLDLQFGSWDLYLGFLDLYFGCLGMYFHFGSAGRRTDGRTGGLTDGRTGRTDGQTDRLTDGRMDVRADVRADRAMDRWTGRRTDIVLTKKHCANVGFNSPGNNVLCSTSRHVPYRPSSVSSISGKAEPERTQTTQSTSRVKPGTRSPRVRKLPIMCDGLFTHEIFNKKCKRDTTL